MRKLLFTTIAISFAATVSQAGPLFFVQAAGQVRVGNSIASPDTGQVQALSATTGTVGFDVVDANGTHFAHMNATASEGHLSGTADAFSHWINFAQLADASTTLLQFFDTITVNSALLAPGTPVNITGTVVLTDTLVSNPATCCSNAGGGALGLNPNDQAGPGQVIAHTVTLHTPLIWLVGSANPFSGSMFFDAGSSSGVSPLLTGSSSVTADMQFFLDPLDPNVTLSSASGASYATPAATVPSPEPGSQWLLLSGLLLGALVIRPRKHCPFSL